MAFQLHRALELIARCTATRRCCAPTSRRPRRRARSSRPPSASGACTSSDARRGARSRAASTTRLATRSCSCNPAHAGSRRRSALRRGLSRSGKKWPIAWCSRSPNARTSTAWSTPSPRRAPAGARLPHRRRRSRRRLRGLTAFAQLVPEVVKIDMSLVRDVGWDLSGSAWWGR